MRKNVTQRGAHSSQPRKCRCPNVSLSEFQIIERFFTRASAEHHSVELGVGDDAAVLRGSAEHDLAISVDSMVSGVHFPADLAAADIGYRALAVNLSDLAAMGATPIAATLALTLAEVDELWVRDFSSGFFELADQFGVALIGGDTTRGPLSITVQVFGHLPSGRKLTRSGAHVGDRIYLSGYTGDAAAGLRLHAAPESAVTKDDTDYLKMRLARPEPRVRLGQHLLALASSAIDVSDGLLGDLEKLAAASSVGAILNLDKLSLSSALARCFAGDARKLALTGGDDYELCFTVVPNRESQLEALGDDLGCAVHCVGEIVAGGGVVCMDAGNEVEIEARSFDHFGAL